MDLIEFLVLLLTFGVFVVGVYAERKQELVFDFKQLFGR